jgi:hypothetical protein
LYGLWQALQAWNSKLDDTLKKMNFVQSEHEHAMYRRSHGDDILLVGVYVDDLVITGSSLAAVKEFKEVSHCDRRIMPKRTWRWWAWQIARL